MPYKAEKVDSCPADKPYGVVGPNGKVHGCHKSEESAQGQITAINIHEHKKGLHEKTAIKRESGMDFPPRDYAYVPDPLRPATWRLRLTQAPGQISLEQLQRAAAAISPAGFRGNKVEIPLTAASSVKRRLLAEFRRLKVDETAIPVTVKEVKVDQDFMVWKDTEGRVRWFTVYSNNFRDIDNPPEILSAAAHKGFVDLVDEGLVDYPELWLWHTPGTTWGKADWVTYSDGFAMASGYVYPGFEHIAENLSKRKDLLVSHGMPKPLVIYDPRYKRTTLFHVTTEISPLPDWAAANRMTGFAILGKGDITMSLPKEKKQFLQEAGLAENVIEQIEANLANARQAAIDAGIESKEITDDEGYDEDYDDETADEEDDDWDDDGKYEDGDEEDAEDGEDDDAMSKERSEAHEKSPLGYGGRKRPTNSKVNWNSDQPKPRRRKKPDEKVNWNSDRTKEGETVEKRVNWNSDTPRRRKKPDEKVNWNSDMPRRRKKPANSKVNWNSDRKDTARDKRGSHTKKEIGDPEYATREEVAEAVSAIIAPILERLEMLSKEISYLQQDDEDRIAATKEVTPTLSLTDMILRRNPIGKSEAVVKGNTSLGKEGPTETKAPVSEATMVPFINGLIDSAYRRNSAE